MHTTEIQMLKQIADDVAEIRTRLRKIEVTFNEVDADLHEVRPEYLEKLKKIEAEGTISQAEFEKQFGVKI